MRTFFCFDLDAASHNKAMWQTLATTFCQTGESPFWHPEEQSLYAIDIPGRSVWRTRGPVVGDGAEPVVERWTMPSEPGCIAPARRGGMVIALRDGIYRARAWGGALARMTPVDYDPQTVRFNDGKCDPFGRLWAGTLIEPKDRNEATLYCLDPRAANRAVPMASDAMTANGLAFAPDAKTLYWADTAAHSVRAWDWDGEANLLSKPRVFLQFGMKQKGWTPESGVAYEGRPDGATIDAEGNYWLAMYEGAQLLCFAPDGTRRAALPVPVQCPTMPCFGGADLKTLFVTSARHGRSEAELSRLPASGAVIACKVQTAGRPVDFFDD